MTIHFQPPTDSYNGVKGKALLLKRQQEVQPFCTMIGKNSPVLRKKFANKTNKSTLNALIDTTVEYCKTYRKEKNISEQGEKINYLLGMKKYMNNVKSSANTLQFESNKINENSPKEYSNNKMSINGQIGGRKTRKARSKRHRHSRARRH